MDGAAGLADDAELVRGVVSRDEAALRVLYERHAPWLSSRLMRRCNDPETVADVLQDTFIAVWDGAARWRGDGALPAWLWGIAVRRLISRLRGRPAAGGYAPAAEPPPTDSAEDVVLLSVEYGDAGAALNGLALQVRAVIQATVLDGLTTREAAVLLGLPHGTVKGRVRAAKRVLRSDLTASFAGQGGWA